MIKTLTQLFSGVNDDSGEFCFYCGGHCGQDNKRETIVKPTFSNWQFVARRGSLYVCNGCLNAFDEKRDIILIDGTERKAQRVRLYSWIVTKNKAIAATKSHIDKLQEFILNPPEPPFGIVLTDSGQKHLLYLGRINYEREMITVLLEEELIICSRDELRKKIQTAELLCAHIGKLSLSGPSIGAYCSAQKGNVENLYNEWLKDCCSPISRLSIWLCRKKEICKNEYITG